MLEGFDSVRTGLHVCRGNWSRDESTLLRGSYHPLQPVFDRIPVRQLVLEYATERAGDLMPFRAKELGLGVVNPRTSDIEPVEQVRASIQRALRDRAPEAVFLNPDCGFGTFSNRPVNGADVAVRKMKVVVEAAQLMR